MLPTISTYVKVILYIFLNLVTHFIGVVLMTIKQIKIDVPTQEGQVSIMFTRGGSRDGAGRKGIGETKKMSLTLSKATWTEIENRCNILNASRSEVFRDIIEAYLNKRGSEG
jgi:hypothetical protein